MTRSDGYLTIRLFSRCGMSVLPGLRGEQCNQELQPHPGLLQEVLRSHIQLQAVPSEGSNVSAILSYTISYMYPPPSSVSLWLSLKLYPL